MDNQEPIQSREMLIENLALQVPSRPYLFEPSDKQFFLAIEDLPGAKKRLEKFIKRDETLTKMKPYDKKLWRLILSESVSQAAEVAKNIGQSKNNFIALLFTGSNRVGLGDYRNPELDFRLITDEEPWEVIDLFREEYGKRSRAKDIRQWRETLGLKLGDELFTPATDEKVEPLAASDLILPADTLDVGWNPENGSLAAITSEAGAFTRISLDNFVLAPNRMQSLKRMKGVDHSFFPILNAMADLAETQLAFSTPI